jgi:hypothetical protein
VRSLTTTDGQTSAQVSPLPLSGDWRMEGD